MDFKVFVIIALVGVSNAKDNAISTPNAISSTYLHQTHNSVFHRVVPAPFLSYAPAYHSYFTPAFVRIGAPTIVTYSSPVIHYSAASPDLSKTKKDSITVEESEDIMLDPRFSSITKSNLNFDDRADNNSMVSLPSTMRSPTATHGAPIHGHADPQIVTVRNTDDADNGSMVSLPSINSSSTGAPNVDTTPQITFRNADNTDNGSMVSTPSIMRAPIVNHGAPIITVRNSDVANNTSESLPSFVITHNHPFITLRNTQDTDNGSMVSLPSFQRSTIITHAAPIYGHTTPLLAHPAPFVATPFVDHPTPLAHTTVFHPTPLAYSTPLAHTPVFTHSLAHPASFYGQPTPVVAHPSPNFSPAQIITHSVPSEAHVNPIFASPATYGSPVFGQEAPALQNTDFYNPEGVVSHASFTGFGTHYEW